eukprot:CAMPEP_0185196952 /NCGR_PEP_ID=MMETSP1140-20130426/39151_1 /TAXON_ID=298111 /ORGANISM="Pavlova sp., Strain CCMP459" /LENGTH=96 /DNA_ID=CAMNT_0027764031 /DNA_START=331 /DNA_END=618 /DNA_ORIENTATION=-
MTPRAQDGREHSGACAVERRLVPRERRSLGAVHAHKVLKVIIANCLTLYKLVGEIVKQRPVLCERAPAVVVRAAHDGLNGFVDSLLRCLGRHGRRR